MQCPHCRKNLLDSKLDIALAQIPEGYENRITSKEFRRRVYGHMDIAASTQYVLLRNIQHRIHKKRLPWRIQKVKTHSGHHGGTETELWKERANEPK